MSRTVCPSICKACPFRKKSLAGWLGQSMNDPWGFLSSFEHGEAPLVCHKQVDWEKPDSQERAQTAPICRGALTMLKNQNMEPRNPELAEMICLVDRDTATVFASSNDFMQYHHPNGRDYPYGKTA